MNVPPRMNVPPPPQIRKPGIPVWGWVLIGLGGTCMCAIIPAILFPVFAQARRAAMDKEMGVPPGFSKPSHVLEVRRFLSSCDATWLEVKDEITDYVKLRKTMNPPGIPSKDPGFISALTKLTKKTRATYNGFKGLEVPFGCEKIFDLQEKTFREFVESEDHLLAAAQKSDRNEAQQSLNLMKEFAKDARTSSGEISKMAKYVGRLR